MEQTYGVSKPTRAAITLPISILLGLFVFYCWMFLKYRPFEIDNPWFLSFSYDTFVEHLTNDQFMNVRFPSGMDGTRLFGRLAAALQYVAFSPIGWRQWPAVILPAAMVTASLGFWWLQLAKLGYSRRFIVCFVLVAGFSEPYISTANKFRFEFFSATLIAAGLLLVARGRPMLGVFLAALAVETEPTAIAGMIPVLLLAGTVGKVNRQLFAKLALSLFGAATVYLSLHPDIFQIAATLGHAQAAKTGFDGGYFRSYFVERNRHLPELLLFVIAAIVYYRRRRRIASHYLGWSALAMTIFSFLMPHGNVAYMIFSYPLLIGMTLEAFAAERRPWLLAVCGLGLFLPQQMYLVLINWNRGYSSADMARITKAIDGAARTQGISDDTLRVYGDYRLWFAHPHFYRSAAESTAVDAANADLYLCYDTPPEPPSMEPKTLFYCPQLKRMLPLRQIDSLTIRNNRVFLYSRQ